MTHRERVLAAVRHEETDRVPLFYRDVPEVEERLCRDLGLADREALLRYFDIDFRWVEPPYVGPPLADPDHPDRRLGIWGVEYRFIRFNERAGYWEPVSHPLENANSPADLASFEWPDLEWFDFDAMTEQIQPMEDYALMTAPSYASPGILQSPIQSLLGMEKSLIDMMEKPAFFHALVDHVMAFVEPFIDRMLAAAGGRIDFLRIGDDYGTQQGLMLSPALWREFLRPAWDRIKAVADRYGATLYLHSCGGVRPLIPDLIDAGVDVLDPLQVKATGMVPAELKQAFGAQLCFSGGVDEQELLPHGPPDRIRSEVHRLCDAMAPGGGFIIGPTHNFQEDIPTENIVALYDAARFWKREQHR